MAIKISANTGEDLGFVAYDDERETTPTSRDSDGTASEDANEVEATDGDRFPAADFESKYFIFYFDFPRPISMLSQSASIHYFSRAIKKSHIWLLHGLKSFSEF